MVDLIEEGRKKLQEAAAVAKDTKEQGQITLKTGLGPMDAAYFTKEVDANPGLKKMFGDLQTDMATSPKYDRFLKAIGDRFKVEAARNDGNVGKNTVVDDLGADLKANPQLADRMKKVLQANPDLVAGSIADYKRGSLDATLTKLEVNARLRKETPAATANAAQKELENGAAIAAAKAVEERSRARRSEPEAKKTTPQPAAKVEPASVAASQPPAAEPPRQAESAQASPIAAAAQPFTSQQILKDLSEASDERIKNTIDDKFIKDLAAGLQEYSDNKFSDLKDKSQGFVDKINSNPKLRDEIAENLRKNPEFVRGLAKAMNQPDSSDENAKKMRDEALRGQLKAIYDNPNQLATDKFAKDMVRGMKMGETMNSLNNFFKGLGIDLSGVMGGVGRFFQGIFNWIGNAFSTFSSGNFMLMGNINPNQSFFGKFGLAMDQADRFSRQAPDLIKYTTALPEAGAKGALGDGFTYKADGSREQETYKYKDAQGVEQEGKRDKYDQAADHRVKVKSINGSEHEIFLTNGLSPQRQATGDYRWTVVDKLDPKTGNPSSLRQVVLSKEESDRLFQKISEGAQISGQRLNVTNPRETAATLAAQQEEMERRNVVRVDAKNGQTSPENFKPQPVPGVQPGANPQAPNMVPNTLQPEPPTTSTVYS